MWQFFHTVSPPSGANAQIFLFSSFIFQREPFHFQLVTPEAYKRYLQLSVNEAESKMANTFHCKTTDCTGWCEFEVNVNLFGCPVCYHNNCLSCQVRLLYLLNNFSKLFRFQFSHFFSFQAIHEGLNCAQYQRKIQIESENNPEARKTLKQLEVSDMLQSTFLLLVMMCILAEEVVIFIILLVRNLDRNLQFVPSCSKYNVVYLCQKSN